jgi:hypothetical protein
MGTVFITYSDWLTYASDFWYSLPIMNRILLDIFLGSRLIPEKFMAQLNGNVLLVAFEVKLNQWTGRQSSHVIRSNERQCQHYEEVQEYGTVQGRITAQSCHLYRGVHCVLANLKPNQWTGPFPLLAIGQNQQSSLSNTIFPSALPVAPHLPRQIQIRSISWLAGFCALLVFSPAAKRMNLTTTWPARRSCILGV